MQSKNLSVTIQCRPKKVYAFISNPRNFPNFAKTFCKSVKRSRGKWLLDTTMGQLFLRICPKNSLGVADHFITLPDGEEIYVPMRVVANGTASQIIFTLFRQPGMPLSRFKKDQELVMRDLTGLKRLLEKQAV